MKYLGWSVLVALILGAFWFDISVLHDGDWKCALNEKCVVVQK